MAEVAYSARALADLARLAEFLVAEAPQAAVAATDTIQDAIEILKRHPEIGRPCEPDLRELVISFGQHGYVALYEFDPRSESVLILSIRHQREAGFRT